MAKYNVDELYKKELLTVPEAAYLMGGIPLQNVYIKLEKGTIEEREVENKHGNPVKRVVTESLYDYILKRRGELLRRIDRYRLPTGYGIS